MDNGVAVCAPADAASNAMTASVRLSCMRCSPADWACTMQVNPADDYWWLTIQLRKYVPSPSVGSPAASVMRSSFAAPHAFQLQARTETWLVSAQGSSVGSHKAVAPLELSSPVSP